MEELHEAMSKSPFLRLREARVNSSFGASEGMHKS
jgi:hypothetical protein